MVTIHHIHLVNATHRRVCFNESLPEGLDELVGMPAASGDITVAAVSCSPPSSSQPLQNAVVAFTLQQVMD